MKRKKIMVGIIAFFTWFIGAFCILSFAGKNERPILIILLGAVVIVFQELVLRKKIKK